MNDDEMYEIARQRIAQRNRRWILWSINLGVLILILAGLILTEGSRTVVTLFLGWGAVFVTHTIIVAFLESTAGSIENEVTKLRAALAESEKPKRREPRQPRSAIRLELGEDGEITEVEDWEGERDARRRRNT